MLVQAGANCNVFSYNYSLEPYQSPPLFMSDISIHGNYPYANLFEENKVFAILADDYHGDNGPYNAIVRNYTDPAQGQEIEIFRAKYTSILGNISDHDHDINQLDPCKAIFSESGSIYDRCDIFGFYYIWSLNHTSAYQSGLGEYCVLSDISYFLENIIKIE